jgi:Ca2+-transporting ATPase
MRKLSLKEKFGQNEQIHKQTHKWWLALFDLKPMLLLIAVAVIYFVMGQKKPAAQ